MALRSTTMRRQRSPNRSRQCQPPMRRGNMLAMHTAGEPIEVTAYLLAIAQSASLPPPWLDAVQQLRPDSTAEQRLAVYRAVRDSGWLSDQQGLYLVASLVDEM